MDIVERVIGALAPGYALQRTRARIALEHVRAYEGAKKGRRTSGWLANGTSANAEIVPDLRTLRNRSRSLVRDNPYALAAINAWVSNAVGTGITAKVDKRAKDAWARWVDLCDVTGDHDFYGLQSLVARSMFESGEGLLVVKPVRMTDPRIVPLKLQVFEPDLIDTAKNENLNNGNVIRAGVEFAPDGTRVAFWLFDEHPGEPLPGARAGIPWLSQRFPAEYVIQPFEKLRPGQVRGVPRFHATLMRLRDMDDYQDAELLRKKIEASFTAFITTDADDPAPDKTEKVQPGTLKYLKSGQTVTFAEGRPVQGYAEYTAVELHAIAAGAGVTFEQMTGDYSRVTYLSARASLQEFRRMVAQWQWITFVPQLCRRVGVAWEQHARIAGLVGPKPLTWLWTPPKWDWIDPSKEVASTKEEIRGGLASLSAKLRERGEDPDEVFAEIAADRRRLADLGLDLDTLHGDGATTSSPSSAQGDDGEDQQDDAGQAGKPTGKE